MNNLAKILEKGTPRRICLRILGGFFEDFEGDFLKIFWKIEKTGYTLTTSLTCPFCIYLYIHLPLICVEWECHIFCIFEQSLQMITPLSFQYLLICL